MEEVAIPVEQRMVRGESPSMHWQVEENENGVVDVDQNPWGGGDN